MTQNLKFDIDAFSAGQIESKIWAAEELEKVVKERDINPVRMYVLGGWYSLLHFILQVRKNINIEYCRSIDLDPIVSYTANKINNTWEINDWQFRAYPSDANDLEYGYDNLNCVVNTSTEHFSSTTWFDLIPNGTIVLLQGNDLEIEDHVNRPTSLDNFKKKFKLSTEIYSGTKHFKFKDMSFNRYMIIGVK